MSFVDWLSELFSWIIINITKPGRGGISLIQYSATGKNYQECHSFQLKYGNLLSKCSSKNGLCNSVKIYPRFGDKVVSVKTSGEDNIVYYHHWQQYTACCSLASCLTVAIYCWQFTCWDKGIPFQLNTEFNYIFALNLQLHFRFFRWMLRERIDRPSIRISKILLLNYAAF